MSKQTKQGAVLKCNLSGLEICKINGLPWAAIPKEIPFAGFTEKQRNKFVELAVKADATNETKHFAIYALLAACPVSFTHIHARSQQSHFDLAAKTWQNIYARGLPRLAQFTAFFSNLTIKQKAEFPIWMPGSGSVVDAAEDVDHPFGQFFSVLNLWEQTAKRFRYIGARDSRGNRLEADDIKLENFLENTDAENIYEAIANSVYKKMRDLQSNTYANIFDSRSVDYKKRPQALKKLAEFYSFNSQNYGELRCIIFNTKACSMERLQKFKTLIIDIAALRDDYPIEHNALISYIRHYIDAKNRIEQVLQSVQSDADNSEIGKKMRAAEIADMQKKLDAGMPRKENYASLAAYMAALMAWKKTKPAKAREQTIPQRGAQSVNQTESAKPALIKKSQKLEPANFDIISLRDAATDAGLEI